MGQRIRITVGAIQAEGKLADNATGRMVAEALPISASARTWGDEIYFPIPVESELEDGKEVVEMGDLGYWPPGNAFCIFFGPTPASRRLRLLVKVWRAGVCIAGVCMDGTNSSASLIRAP